jgi:C1A family cysteine protease
MVLVGYDLSKKLFLVRNSFGTDWCIDGYCWITFAYMKEKLLDAWIFDIDLTP